MFTAATHYSGVFSGWSSGERGAFKPGAKLAGTAQEGQPTVPQNYAGSRSSIFMHALNETTSSKDVTVTQYINGISPSENSLVAFHPIDGVGDRL